jgi:hypothetical protein
MFALQLVPQVCVRMLAAILMTCLHLQLYAALAVQRTIQYRALQG